MAGSRAEASDAVISRADRASFFRLLFPPAEAAMNGAHLDLSGETLSSEAASD